MKFNRIIYGTILGLVLALFPQVAYAHDGGNVSIGGFLSGLLHPVLGLDHLLAMLSVGILSAQIGGRAIWSIPATFVGVMAVGGAIGLANITLFSPETGIAFSLVLLGTVIAADRQLPYNLAMVAVGFFAVFHGYAHGLEIPETAEPILYALGFLTGTIIIHIVGVLIGDISQHYARGKTLLRVGGGAIAGIGILYILGAL